jgi:hypothetical protein
MFFVAPKKEMDWNCCLSVWKFLRVYRANSVPIGSVWIAILWAVKMKVDGWLLKSDFSLNPIW